MSDYKLILNADEVYNQMRANFEKIYIKNFEGIVKNIKSAYDNGIEKTSEKTYESIRESMRQNLNLKEANIVSYDTFNKSIQELKFATKNYTQRTNNLKIVFSTLSELEKYLQSNNQEMPITLKSSLNRINQLLTEGSTTSKYRGVLKPWDAYYGTVNNIIGSVGEIYTEYEINKVLDKDLFTIEMAGAKTVDLNWKNKIKETNITDARDIVVKTTSKGAEISIGISVKNYKLDNKNRINVKLRESSFSVVLNMLKLGGTQYLPLTGKGFNKQNLFEQFVVGFHDYKAKVKNNDSIKNPRFDNYKAIMELNRAIVAMVLLDRLVGQSDFNKQGLQIMIANGKMLDFNTVIPAKIPSVEGMGPTSIYKVSPPGGNPSYNSVMQNKNYYSYLERYIQLKTILRHQIQL